MNLFRPIGLDWFTKGFWKIAEPYGNPPDTIDQYLGVPDKEWHSRILDPVQQYGEVEFIDGIYYIPLKIGSGEYTQKAITFDTFLKMDFDLIVATYLRHDEPYAKLVQEYMPKATYIRHIGDTGVLPTHTRNVLAAIKTPMPDTNCLTYHPEHHVDYSYSAPVNHNVVKSFLTHIRFMPDYRYFLIYEKALPDFTFKMHGIDERDSVIQSCLMPQAIKDSAFVWHVKHTGCGGFIPRQALACGRPCIVKKHYCDEWYTLEGDLYEDSVNCIDLDLGTPNQNIEKIRFFSEPDRHREMCRNTAEKFRKDVDFDKEAQKIKEWINNLLKR